MNHADGAFKCRKSSEVTPGQHRKRTNEPFWCSVVDFGPDPSFADSELCSVRCARSRLVLGLSLTSGPNTFEGEKRSRSRLSSENSSTCWERSNGRSDGPSVSMLSMGL